MAAKFGTSGLRGLVSELTPALVAGHVRAFLSACDSGAGLCVGRDLRPSSPRIAEDVIRAARGMGIRVMDCGAVPTPALALRAQAEGFSAVMVTGSHIPADRNGLKFYSRKGEITKAEEAAILAALGAGVPEDGASDCASEPEGSQTEGQTRADLGALSVEGTLGAAYVARYVTALGPGVFRGRRIGVYSHSAVARDEMLAVFRDLGAEVIELGRSDHFIPVDTEAVDPEVAAAIRAWVVEHQLDALVSTDGDSDRPLLADEQGRIVPGDLLGQITAESLGADTVVTPISSNSGVLQKGFGQVLRTKIGSPFVIAAMEAAGGRVAGYEANGGFLLGYAAQGPAGPLAALPTRDCLLPLVMVLWAAGTGPVSARIAQEPPVVTRADRLQEIAPEISQPFLAELIADPGARAAFLAPLGGQEAAVETVDGLRITLRDGRVLHLRPSGNAPEFRLYVEAAEAEAAEALLTSGLTLLRAELRPL